MIKVYLCGDSFFCVDSDWPGYSWPERLQQKLGARAIVINLARRCSSNFFNRLQIDHAIQGGADFIVLGATSSFRQEVRLRSIDQTDVDLFDRFIDLQHDHVGTDLTTYSLMSLDHSTRFSQEQLHLLTQYHRTFFDADLEVVRNWHVIQGSLDAMTRAKIPFVFTPGGFEHHSYPGAKSLDHYWADYLDHVIPINLWDHTTRRDGFARPYFHVENHTVLEDFANECLQAIDRIYA